MSSTEKNSPQYLVLHSQTLEGLAMQDYPIFGHRLTGLRANYISYVNAATSEEICTVFC